MQRAGSMRRAATAWARATGRSSSSGGLRRARHLSGLSAGALDESVNIGRHAPGSMLLGELAELAKPVVTVDSDADIMDAVSRMTEAKASTLFVEHKSHLVGVLKESDLVKYADAEASDGFMRGSVLDVMEENVQYGTFELSLREGLALLNSSKQDHLPILHSDALRDGNNPAAGRVCVLDVTELLSAKRLIEAFYAEVTGASSSVAAELPLEEREKLESAAQNAFKLPTVKSIIKSQQRRSEEKGDLGLMVLNTHVSDEISVGEVMGQMTKFNKGSVAVMDICHGAPVLVGIATEQDIVRRALAPRLNLRETLVTDIMTRSNLVSVNTKETLLACAFKMSQMDVRHLPVLSPKGERVLSMISSKDVVSFLAAAAQEASEAA